jgi:cytochrome b6-f complex iron-sulfur subunit
MTCPGRRTVLKGAAAACGAGLLSACGGGDQAAAPAPSPGGGRTPPEGGLRASLAAVDDIPVGGAIAASAPDGSKVLLTRPSGNDVQGFSAVCPHEGCTVAPDDEQLACPCHGSQFELNGELKRGPARTGLTPFPVEVVDGQVLPA